MPGKVIDSNQQGATAVADGSKLPVSSLKFESREFGVVLLLVGAMAATATVAMAVASVLIVPIICALSSVAALCLLIGSLLLARKGYECVKIAHSKDNPPSLNAPSLDLSSDIEP